MVLFTIYITFVFTALYTILRSLCYWYRHKQYERELENEAYERLLRQIAEADSTFNEADTGDGRKSTPHDTSNVNAEHGEDMHQAYEEDSDSESRNIVRTSVRRKSRHAEYAVPLIGDAKYGTIAQRRTERL